MEITVITGMSGSGKSVVLHVFEDAGYYCIDNLPPELLPDFVRLQQSQPGRRVAIAMDVRSATALPQLPQQLAALQAQGIQLRKIFLDAQTATLVHRYSETRRRHPLSMQQESNTGADHYHVLEQAIALEREMLTELRAQSHVIDTSLLRVAQLRTAIKDLIDAPASQLTLVFESFAFKRGIPLDADYVFDVRMLPNPYYDPQLRTMTGRDAPVAHFLRKAPAVQQMQHQITQFLEHWLPPLLHDHRSYVTVAIGCTGGQHRSVYLVEQLAAHFQTHWVTLKRHRELDAP